VGALRVQIASDKLASRKRGGALGRQPVAVGKGLFQGHRKGVFCILLLVTDGAAAAHA
jgi:hypothetical protein